MASAKARRAQKGKAVNVNGQTPLQHLPRQLNPVFLEPER